MRTHERPSLRGLRPPSRTARTGSWLLVGLVLTMVLLGSAACGGKSQDESGPKRAVSGPAPRTPSVYMTESVQRYNLLHSEDKTPWRPVERGGRRWAGDPATYEKVCGAKFLDEDGQVPGFYSDGSGGRSWFDELRADPDRWGAFNAWLADPAVRKANQDAVDSVRAGGATGGTPPLGDYSSCTRRSEAGAPLG